MTKAAGYLLNVASGRRSELQEAMELGETLAEAVPEFSHSRNAPLVCFVGFEPEFISHLADGRRGHRAGTGLRRLNLHSIEGITPFVSHSDIRGRVPSRFRSSVSHWLARGGILSPSAFEQVVDIVRDLCPMSRALLDRFSRTRHLRVERISPRARDSLAYQKEAVSAALTFAGFDRRKMLVWDPPAEAEAEPASFLDGLAAVHLREDAMVVHDMMTLPGFNLLRTTAHSGVVFERPGARLTVVLANRLPLERQLGADLVYLNESYRAFVVVQYKAMERTGDGAVFRLPDTQLAEEIERMEHALTELEACPPNKVRDGFRLLENPFFLKLCPRLVFDPDDSSLVPGMYLPLPYWRMLHKEDRLLGPGGGRRVTFENVGRYLDNTQFVSLVAEAWIGTTPPQSAVLERVIRSVLEGGRAVALAIKTVVASVDTGPFVGTSSRRGR